ncbi:MAG: peptide antibiotic transporter SbmA [Hyphomicrobiaceae bacterium]
MFKSFFPRPRLLLLSALIYAAIAAGLWLLAGDAVMARFGVAPVDPEQAPIGLAYFVTPQFLAFCIYYGMCCALFAAVWFRISPHPWQWWSIAGSMLIIFSSYFSVQVNVAINNWRRPFFDKVQEALSGKGTVPAAELYRLLLIFAEIAFVWIAVYVATRFFVSHFIFRWRTAMNDHYMARWKDVRHIEGAAQRVQEDTMRFASITEDLGVSMIESVMTLFAFLPVLFALSGHVTELPIVGQVPAALVVASIVWSLFGTVLLAGAGIKLPGLNFRIQRVEAAYRKELVYGEDDVRRAGPISVRELFGNVTSNYFRLYFHYAYFNVFRATYIQADNIFAYLILLPTMAAGKITFGILQQILTAFQQVSNSFQYLVNSWSTIVELMSIYKRLAAFEAAFEGKALTGIETEPETTP